MIRRMINLATSVAVFGVLLYFFFFVPLGRRTLYEHATRISETDEAEDLGEDVGEAAGRLEDRVREELAP
jgi:hypothetical protein